jgi:hypothetical protein
MFDTQQGMLSALPIIKKDGMVVSISTMPSGSQMRTFYPDAAGWLVYILNIMDFFLRSWTSWGGVNYSYLFMTSKGKDLERISQWVVEGKIKTIVGRQAKLSDLDGVRAGCQELLEGKGGVGKFVIDID